MSVTKIKIAALLDGIAAAGQRRVQCAGPDDQSAEPSSAASLA